MLGFFNKEELIAKAKEEVFQLWKKRDEEREQQKKECELSVLKMKLGKLVISVSNEISNVTVGVAKDIIFISQAQQPYLVIQDIITGEELVPMGTMWDYTEQKFDALNKLEPNERISIIYNKLGYHYVDKSPTQKTIPEESEIWGNKVKKAVELWKLQNKSKWEEMNQN
jgi:hypothetical protein